MRDNEDRFRTPDSGESPAVHEQMSPGLNFTMPTEMVELPSKGLLYPEGHPLHGKDTLEIKFMTAKEEDILTSKALIKKGVAIDRMLQSLILDKNVKVEELLIGDKNALTIAARISGYGQDYEVKVTCPACETKSTHSFDLSQLESRGSEMHEEAGVTRTPRGTFLVKLLKSDVEVEFRLLTGKDEAEIVSGLNKKTVGTEEKNSTTQLKRLIVSLNGVNDRKTINDFVDMMPVVDAKLLRNLVKDITPDVDMSQEFECASCGHAEEMEVPFTVEFFWPK